MVGLKYCSIFNPAYFFQYLLVNFPHRSLSEITPQAGHSLPFQILYFHKAHLLMGNTFFNGPTFAATLEVYGHKQYYLPTISSYIQSLIDLNNFYKRQLLSSNSTLPQTNRTSRQASELRGNQLVFYNYFKEIVEYREQCLLSTNNNVDSDVDWKRFPLVLGKPGTGKSFTLQHCIYFCMSYVIRFTLSQQYRIEDDFLLQFLHHIRYDAPTKDMVDKLCRDRILCHTGTVTENVYEHLKKLPDSLVLTVTRRSASFINNIVISNVFTNHPLALVVAED